MLSSFTVYCQVGCLDQVLLIDSNLSGFAELHFIASLQTNNKPKWAIC